ncbi:MAG TPA: M3 family oligoendopeptidase, partial [Clostridiales bacterium]|nr:M3 family oligoendopeptidase [Clostridiales bacterium]
MNKEWSLDVLYKGYNDENYINDIKSLINLNKDIEAFSSNLINEDEKVGLLKAIEYMEDYSLLARKLSFFVELKQSTNTSDVTTVNESNKLEKLISESTKSYAILTKYLARIGNKEKYAKENPKIKSYLYLLNQMEIESKYLLSDDVEDIISKLNISAASAWSSMQSFLTSTLDVEFDDKTLTLSEIRNLAYSHDKEIRKKAYKAEIASYEKINDAISFSLNNIKTQVNTICNLRGFESPLHETLEKSKMKKETLDAMLLAMQEYMPVFHKYLKHKAKLLSHKNGLPWYDLFAPLGESEKKFTEIEARDYLLKHFRSFSDDLADM